MANNFAKIALGQNFKPQATSAIASPANGDLYYDSTRGSFTEYIGGFWFDHASKTDVASGASLTSANFTASVVQSSLVKLTGSTSGNIHGLTASASAKTVLLYNASTQQQIIKNQSATEGTAANRITTPTSADTSLPSGQSALLVYDITAATWVLVSISGSSGGSGTGKNYLSAITTSQSSTPNTGNGNFELGSTTGWSTKHSTLDSNNKMPNQASGSWTAANANMTFSVINSSTLSQQYSGQVAFSSASIAGDMLVSDAFNIDAEDQNQVLAVQASFKVTANSSNGNFTGSINNSFSVALYDVTNGTWIQVQNNYGLVLGSNVTKFYGTFQTSTNGTQYRLALYNMNASAGAITYEVDSFSVGPQAGNPNATFTAPTKQVFTSGSGTYLLPTGPQPAFLKIRMVGGGGGGGAAGPSGSGAGTAGGNTTFGSSLLTANGGNPGPNSGSNSVGGAGGTATVSAPATQLVVVQGGNGNGNTTYSATSTNVAGGQGGNTPLGFGYTGSGSAANAGAAGQQYGAGGGGGSPGATGAFGGVGGGGGGYLEAIISNPASSYSYSVGAGGTHGTNAGTGNANGGDGAGGIIIVEEYYSSALTNASSSGASTGPTVQKFLSGSGTYQLPTGPMPLWIEVEMIGGGGGGGGSGTTNGTGGSNGGNTTFGSSLLTANGGNLGSTVSAGTGGTATVNSPAVSVVSLTGSSGGGGSNNTVVDDQGGMGAGSPFGGGGSSGIAASGTGGSAGGNAVAYGSGGGGAGDASGAGAAQNSGGGGGSGGYVRAIITSPSTSYSYSVGSGGSGQTAGTGGANGGNGASGIIIVREFYASSATSIVPVKKAPTYQTFTSGSGTYVLPTGPMPLYLKIRMCGGGGGGDASGSGAFGANNGSAGGNTTFAGNLQANGGGKGSGNLGNGSFGGGGGTDVSSYTSSIVNISSRNGQNGTGSTGGPSQFYASGSPGGSTPYFGGAGVGVFTGAGGAGTTNSGGGGAGGGNNLSANVGLGSGGGSGAYVEAIIYNPASSYAYSVGAAGSGNTNAGTNGFAGGAGGSGVIIVEEHYQ